LDAAYTLARWIVQRDQDAQDIVQDAYVRASKGFEGFHGVNAQAPPKGNLRSPGPGGTKWIVRNPDALPYGMAGAELNRQHELCTFQVLVERFGLRDRVVQRLAEIVHDADLEDDAFHTIEGFGIDQVLKGWAKLGLSDEEILRRGFDCFNGLQARFKRA
jgi:hypothetical protein